MFKQYIIWIIILLLIMILLLWIFCRKKNSQYKSQYKSKRNLIKASPPTNYDMGYSKSFYTDNGNPYIPFHIHFQTIPIVFGCVVNLCDGGNSFNSSVYSTHNVDNDKFTPLVFQSWPTLGINYLALAQELNSSKFQFATFTPNGVKIVIFNQPFQNIPVVIVSSNGQGNHQIYISDITTYSFNFEYTNGWAGTSFNYLAVDNVSLNELPFQVQFGKQTSSPSVDNWIGGISFPYEFQDTPVVFATPVFIPQDHSITQCNATIDSISRKMFHLNISGGWPDVGACWIAIGPKTTQTSSSSQFPVNIVSDYIQDIILPENAGNSPIFFRVPIDCPDPTNMVILATPIDVMMVASHSDKVLNTISPIVNISNITENEFECCFGTNLSNPWPLGGLQYVGLSRNKTSSIAQTDTPYLIDFGRFDPDSFPDHGQEIYIPFNIEFPSTPKIITSYHALFDFERQMSMTILKRTKTYFTLQFTGYIGFPNNKFKPPYPIHWMAVLETNKNTYIPPFSFEVGLIDSINSISASHEVNGSTGNVFGLGRFKTKYNSAPRMVMGTSIVQIDTIFSDLFHVNSAEFSFMTLDPSTSNIQVYPIYWMSLKVPDGTTGMPFYQCAIQEYIDPNCPQLQTDPSSCPKNTVDYIKLSTIQYLPFITKIGDPCSATIDVSLDSPPLYISKMVICNIFLSKGELSAYSDLGSICFNRTNQLTKSGGRTQWVVNADYGYFSFCDSFGNVLIRINSSFASTDVINLEFIGFGISSNFQFYIQFGTANDMIHGPYKYHDIVELEFGHPKCSPGNIKCQVIQVLRDICVPVLKYTIGRTQKAAIGEVCGFATTQMGVECVGALGGPENVVGDAVCAVLTGEASYNCAGAVKLLTENTAMSDPAKMAQFLCDHMYK